MKRPVLHDKRFAMSDDWERHAEELEKYATYLEGGLDVSKTIIHEQGAELERLRAPKKATSPDPTADHFKDLFNDFFGKRGT